LPSSKVPGLYKRPGCHCEFVCLLRCSCRVEFTVAGMCSLHCTCRWDSVLCFDDLKFHPNFLVKTHCSPLIWENIPYICEVYTNAPTHTARMYTRMHARTSTHSHPFAHILLPCTPPFVCACPSLTQTPLHVCGHAYLKPSHLSICACMHTSDPRTFVFAHGFKYLTLAPLHLCTHTHLLSSHACICACRRLRLLLRSHLLLAPSATSSGMASCGGRCQPSQPSHTSLCEGGLSQEHKAKASGC